MGRENKVDLLVRGAVQRFSWATWIPWKKSLPFVLNPMGVLIHRPKWVTTKMRTEIGVFKYPEGISAGYLCNAQSHGVSVVGDVPVGKMVCFRCEQEAIRRGLKSSAELVGHDVKLGGVLKGSRVLLEKKL